MIKIPPSPVLGPLEAIIPQPPDLYQTLENMNNFKILIRRRIPLLSSFLCGLLVISFGLAAILYIIMLPTKSSSEESTIAYYILVVPQSIKIISAIGVVGLLISIPLYFRARLNKQGQLTYNEDKITISGKGFDMTMNTKLIDKIFINDLRNSKRELKHKLQIVIQPKYGKQVVFQLEDYNDCDRFISNMGKLQNVEFSFYDDNIATLHHDE